MKIPKRGEKGFTLIELLIVIAILGVLAAIVIPNVGRFIGAGEEEAAATEATTVQAAVQAMMTDLGIAQFTGIIYTSANETNDMTAFPNPPNYVLFDNPIVSTGIDRYIGSNTTIGYYSCDVFGVVTQESY